MLTNYPVISRLGVIFLDNVITIASFFIAIYVRNSVIEFYEFGKATWWNQHLMILILIIIIWRGISGYQEAYIGQRHTSLQYVGQRFTSLRSDILIVVKTVLIGCAIVFSIAFVFKSTFAFSSVPRSLMAFFFVINITMLSLEKVILHKFVKYLRIKGKSIKNVLVVGTGDVTEQFIDSVRSYPDWGIRILGLIGKNQSSVGKERYGYKIIGYSANLTKIIHLNPVDELVIALPAKHLGGIEDVINTCDNEGIPVRIISPFFKNIISKARTELIHGLPVIQFMPVQRNDLEMVLKRIMDIVFSLIGIIVLAPLFIVIIILIRLDSSGPMFYRWKILGLNKRRFVSYKFRTMVVNADDLKEGLLPDNEMNGVVFKIKNDPRITRVGKWLRKYSLDELPQLWSVLKGDLSLVGPRPPLQSEVEEYEGWHKRRLSVKPGITCSWQTSGRNEISDFNEWMKLDLKYIDEWNLLLDLKILMKTFLVVLKGSGR